MTATAYYTAAVVLAVAVAIGFAMKEGRQVFEPTRQAGAVRYVIDGDTLILSHSESRLRLWGVDAPEEGERGYHEARNQLVRLSKGKRITYEVKDTDQYGRIVARVFVGKREINALMIESGTAREYRRFSKGFYSR